MSIGVKRNVTSEFNEGKDERHPTIIYDRVKHEPSEDIDKNAKGSEKSEQGGPIEGKHEGRRQVKNNGGKITRFFPRDLEKFYVGVYGAGAPLVNNGQARLLLSKL